MLRRHLSREREAVLRQFLRFGLVGVVCFGVDAAVVYALRGALGLYAAGFASYVVAASLGWVLNRIWTFRSAAPRPMLRQWSTFLVAGMAGLLLNRGAYVALILASATAAEHPIIAVAAGAVAGMFVNFGMNRAVVFR